MSYSAKNHNEQGGARTVVGGSLDVVTGGDLDVEAGASLKIAGAAVTATAAELNAAAAALGVANALVGAMVGGYASADHADDTSETKIEVLPANESGDGARAILILAKISQTFAATTNKPIFVIEDGTSVTYATLGHGGSPATPEADEIHAFAGSLAEERPVVIAVTDGTGGAEAGAIEVYVIALPAGT